MVSIYQRVKVYSTDMLKVKSCHLCNNKENYIIERNSIKIKSKVSHRNHTTISWTFQTNGKKNIIVDGVFTYQSCGKEQGCFTFP